MKHSNRARLSKLSLGLMVALAAAPVFAQSTSSGVGGQVVSAGGQPVAGAEVTITHVESGTISRATTDASGRYNARGLRVGGPYTIVVNKPGEGTKTQDGVYLELNQVSTVNATLGESVTNIETVQVVGDASAYLFDSNNKGVGTSISGRQLETAVSGNRSLDDIARLDPRVTVTDQNDGSISVAGQNNRYNTISVDGLSVNDPFGLNANGLGFTGSPISPDTIAAYDIKISEFDVVTDAVGASINAVTKSGTNDFHGSVYYTLTDAGSMVGRLGGSAYKGFDKNETKGATFGGPIIKDRLFFFGSYEEQEISGLAGVGTDAVSSGKLTSQQVGDVASAFDAIGIKAGTYGSAGDVSLKNKRSLAKFDWNINDSHRASFTFQRTEETKPTPYSSYVKDISAILPSNWYTVASKTDNYSVQLFSDWSENFSTEFKVGYQKYNVNNGAAIDQPEVYACFTAVATDCTNFASNAKAPWVIAGEDRYRHENSIDSTRISGTLSGTYYAGNHTIKGGVDFLSNEVANVFGQLLHGSYGFYDKNNNGTPVDEILAKNYGFFVKNYLPDGVNLADSAGTWKYTQISPFLQDTWQATDNLSLTFGVRVNIPKADHAPPVALESATSTAPGATAGEPVWESRFGYTSATTLGSKNKVIEPRVAFNYTFDSERQMQLRGGVGLFQTVPPYVWLTNAYTNNGVVSAKQYSVTNSAAGASTTDPFSADPNNQPGPTSVAAGVCATNATCQIDVLDPDFKMPGAWKFALGFDTELPWGLTGSIEYQHIKAKNAIDYMLPNIGTPKGKLPDGRDSYWQTYPNASTTQIGNGTNNGAYAEINTRSSLLTNSNKGGSDSVTFSLSKALSNGFRGNFSITQTHSTEVNPGTASQAYSNYNYVTRVNPNDSLEATSRFDVPLSVKASMSWDHAFFGDYKTTISMYYNGHSGQPYSWTFGTDVNGDSINNVDLAYIPLVNDPIVTYKAGTTAAQIQAFQNLIDSDPYLSSRRGQIAGRNDSHQPWINQLDVGFQQELPGFFKGNKVVVRLDIYNFLNMLNKDWGQQNGVGYFGTRRLAYVTDVANGKYVYDIGTEAKPSWQDFGVYDTYTNPARVISRWQALLTVRYQF
ncbi:TonB-dependent receptor [Thermomonas brevis]|nr:TonB-dependent receptor [Thermomonas brevis]